MARWATGFLVALLLLPVVLAIRPLWCIDYEGGLSDFCAVDVPDLQNNYTAVVFEGDSYCGTVDGTMKCWAKLRGKDDGLTWNRYELTGASPIICSPDQCNDGAGCLPKGPVFGSVAVGKICLVTQELNCTAPNGGYRDIDPRDLPPRNIQESSGEAEEEMTCRTETAITCTTPQIQYQTQWLCDKSSNGISFTTGAMPSTMPALYKCDASTVGRTFNGSQGQFCCQYDTQYNTYRFDGGACQTPDLCPYPKVSTVIRGTSGGLSWTPPNNFDEYQNICCAENTCSAGGQCYNPGTTWVRTAGSTLFGFDNGQSWVCGKVSGAGRSGFFRCGVEGSYDHRGDLFKDEVTGKCFMCGNNQVFTETPCGVGEVRIGDNNGADWYSRNPTPTTKSCAQYAGAGSDSCTSDDDRKCCNTGVGTDNCIVPGSVIPSGKYLNWICMPPNGQSNTSAQDRPALYRAAGNGSLKNTYDGVTMAGSKIRGQYELGINSRFCAVEKTPGSVGCDGAKFVPGSCDAIANCRDVSRCLCPPENPQPPTSIKWYGGQLSEYGASYGVRWSVDTNAGTSSITCDPQTQCNNGTACVSQGISGSNSQWVCGDVRNTGENLTMNSCPPSGSLNGQLLNLTNGAKYCCTNGQFKTDLTACNVVPAPTCDPTCGLSYVICSGSQALHYFGTDSCATGCSPWSYDVPCAVGTTCFFKQNVGWGCHATCDADFDGYNGVNAPASCSNRVDCNDNDFTVHPGATESIAAGTCSDAKDNDCDARTDYDGFSSGFANPVTATGDESCPVGISAVSATDATSVSACSQAVTITCTTTVGSVRSIAASLNGVACTAGTWSIGNTIPFTCARPADGDYTAQCVVTSTSTAGTSPSLIDTSTIACLTTVSGTVRDAKSNLPIRDATVTVKETAQMDLTDSAGVYSISDIALGTRTLIATAPGYYEEQRANFSVSSSPDPRTDVDFTLSPEQCTSTCTFKGVCDYTCIGQNGCMLSAISEKDQEEFKEICSDAKEGSLRNFNATHMADCCSGTIESKEESRTSLVLKSCATTIVPRTVLVNYNGKIHQLNVVSYKKCEEDAARS